MLVRSVFALFCLTAMGMAAAQSERPLREAAQQEPSSQKRRAVAKIEPRSASDLEGEAFFVSMADGNLAFGVYVENAEPGLHAVHIHENGDCSAPDASSAGDHWNPTGEQHGKWGEESFHLGDIGNIDVGPEGEGNLEMTTDLWTLDASGERSVLGKAVVVHSGADDFETQPDGDAGERVGCGVIELREKATESDSATR